MAKLFVVAAVIAVVATLAAATALVDQPPKLAGKLGLGRKVGFQRCKTCNMKECETLVEFTEHQCHDHPGLFTHGEILRANYALKKRPAFRESFYDHENACSGTPLLSRPREFNHCKQDVLPGRFSVVKQNTTDGNLIVGMDCDWGCGNCNLNFVHKQGTCTTPPHPKFAKFAFSSGPTFDIGGDKSWQEITSEAFFSRVCDGQPDFVDQLYTTLCYIYDHNAHQYVILE